MSTWILFSLLSRVVKDGTHPRKYRINSARTLGLGLLKFSFDEVSGFSTGFKLKTKVGIEFVMEFQHYFVLSSMLSRVLGVAPSLGSS